MRTHDLHKRWLLVTAFVIFSFGPIFAVAAYEPASGPARWTLDLLSWPLDGSQTYADPTTQFLSALTGGFLAGWGMMVFCLRQWVYDAAPEGVRRSVVLGACTWVLVDSVGSWMSGNPSNVLFNAFFLLLAIGPLWLPATD